MMRLLTPFILLVSLSLLVVEARGQVYTVGRIQVSTAMVTRGTSSSPDNFYGESVSRFDRSLGLGYAQVAYRQGPRLLLWARYANAFNPESQVLSGMDRRQKSFFLGVGHRAGAYQAQLEYGYHAYQDSLYQDALSVEQRYELANGMTPVLYTWMGVGKQALIEWMVQAGLVIPLGQQLGVEPMLTGVRTLLHPGGSTLAGVRVHVGFFEKGKLQAAVSREVNPVEHAQTALVLTGTLPFLQSHLLHLTVQQNTVQQNTVQPDRTTLFALGLTLGLGRQGERGR